MIPKFACTEKPLISKKMSFVVASSAKIGVKFMDPTMPVKLPVPPVIASFPPPLLVISLLSLLSLGLLLLSLSDATMPVAVIVNPSVSSTKVNVHCPPSAAVRVQAPVTIVSSIGSPLASKILSGLKMYVDPMPAASPTTSQDASRRHRLPRRHHLPLW